MLQFRQLADAGLKNSTSYQDVAQGVCNGPHPAFSCCMPKPLRMLEPDKIYFVTNRTMQGRLLLKPSPHLNQLIGGALARKAKEHNIEIFAAVFTSNHFHIILRAPAGELPRFMSAFQSKVAKEVGKLHNWSDKVWGRRYSDEAILDDQALLEKLAYIFSHGVKEGLVDESREWPGLTTIPELCNGLRRRFLWIDRTGIYNAQRRNKGRAVKQSDYVEEHTLEVAVLPCWEGLSEKERQKRARAILRAAEKRAKEMREGKPALGRAKVLGQDPHSKPVHVKRSPRPLCHTTSKKLLEAYRTAYRAFVDAYRVASAAFRAGVLDVEFPMYSFPPPQPMAQAGPAFVV